MTFIKIDPTALRLALTKVSSFATSYEQSASSIRSKNLVEGYPADLSSLATADTSVGELKTTVSEIKTRIKSAEQIGSSGITFSEAPTGTYCIGSLCIKTFSMLCLTVSRTQLRTLRPPLPRLQTLARTRNCYRTQLIVETMLRSNRSLMKKCIPIQTMEYMLLPWLTASVPEIPLSCHLRSCFLMMPPKET